MSESNAARAAPVTPLPSAAGPSTSVAAPDGAPMAKRKRLFGILAGAVVFLALATGIWLLLTYNDVTTDNAYVDADLVQVTPLFGGPVAASYVTDTDWSRRANC